MHTLLAALGIVPHPHSHSLQQMAGVNGTAALAASTLAATNVATAGVAVGNITTAGEAVREHVTARLRA